MATRTFVVSATQVIKRKLSCYVLAETEQEAERKYKADEIEDWDDTGDDEVLDDEITEVEEYEE